MHYYTDESLNHLVAVYYVSGFKRARFRLQLARKIRNIPTMPPDNHPRQGRRRANSDGRAGPEPKRRRKEYAASTAAETLPNRQGQQPSMAGEEVSTIRTSELGFEPDPDHYRLLMIARLVTKFWPLQSCASLRPQQPAIRGDDFNWKNRYNLIYVMTGL